MLLAKACRAGVTSPALTLFVKTPNVSTKLQLSKGQIARLFVSDGRSSYTRTARRRATTAEQAMAPAGETGELEIFSLRICSMWELKKKRLWLFKKHSCSVKVIKRVNGIQACHLRHIKPFALTLCILLVMFLLQLLILEKELSLEEQWWDWVRCVIMG